MRVPKASKGGFSGQMNNAAKDIKSNMGKQARPTSRPDNRGMPTVQERVSNRLNGQPKGKATCGMDDKLLSRLKTSKRGI
jgi:hypothetical protein